MSWKLTYHYYRQSKPFSEKLYRTKHYLFLPTLEETEAYLQTVEDTFLDDFIESTIEESSVRANFTFQDKELQLI